MHDIQSLLGGIEKLISQPPEKVSIVRLVDAIIECAFASGASDVHVEPAVDKVRIRFRVDGLLRDIFEKTGLPKPLHQEIVSRVKVIAGLRTDEHSLPQDGRFKVKIKDAAEVDVRVSIMPTYYGENLVMRLLAETRSFTLEDLGFQPQDLAKVERAIARPYGMILANGPTGSGKTTTLYTILKKLNHPEASIITIEDPMEYSFPGTTQIQVNTQAGLTFANGLRSILRQDPNIIMVGEIRDAETAGISVNAALTGHLVLSTLHTNDAATTFPRLIDMNVPPFLVASTINIVMGQRLVRMICSACKETRNLTDAERASLKELLPELPRRKAGFYAGKGCARCGGTGYQGRIGVREVLEINQEIRELVMRRANASEIKAAAVQNGMTTMIQDGLQKAADGITTLEEVLRIIRE